MTLKKLKMGMVGGGQGAFIGDVHRLAARLDGQIELVAGAFSRDPDNCASTGRLLGLDPSRCYADFEVMMRAEAALPVDARMDFVAIVTPNHMHLPVAQAALEAGFHVLSDKPATLNLAEAIALVVDGAIVRAQFEADPKATLVAVEQALQAWVKLR